MRLSSQMKVALSLLSQEDAYIREASGGYEIGATNYRVAGVRVNPRMARSTLRGLLDRGLIVFGKRQRHSVQQVGHFLKGTLLEMGREEKS